MLSMINWRKLCTLYYIWPAHLVKLQWLDKIFRSMVILYDESLELSTLDKVTCATRIPSEWNGNKPANQRRITVQTCHYIDVIMSAMASQITNLTIVYSTVYSGADQRKHQSSASLAFVRGIHRWPVNSPHKGPVTRKMSPFHDVIMATPTNSDCVSLHAFSLSTVYFHTLGAPPPLII